MQRGLSLIADLEVLLGSLAVKSTLRFDGTNLTATQCRGFKHTLEPECRFGVGFLGLFFRSRLLVLSQ